MVQVSVAAAVKVAGGPQLPLDLTLDPESYTLHFSRLTEAGGETDKDELTLPDGTMVLLAVTAVDAEEKPAKVELELSAGTKTEVTGAFVVANADAIDQLVTAGEDRVVKIENKSDKPVTVQILTCRDPDTADE
ncbi:hypothetical protein [Streptomyces sp. NBC_01244]|uniref:hypothetical protein n=1 Tax=Streptomyces sp. NBC_01244 TaxID=2903797 RepID=UPI002E13CB4A|nr:hypothetical protein OG247_36470 [Streptomyces sp. NBC_01244]